MENTIRTIDPSNLDRYGFFCYKSKPKTQGFLQKREWLACCLSEGVRIKMIYEGERSVGFIEYATGESTWRVVHAPGYLVIHCMWVVGSAKGKGYGTRLLEQVLDDAERLGMFGVAVVSSASTWLAKKGFFLMHGFQIVDHAPPSFELLVKRSGSCALPVFAQDWEKRLQHIPDGLVIYHSGQCPYQAMFVTSLLNAASAMGIPAHTVELKSSWEARNLSPTAYGVFGVVYNGHLLSYRPMGGKTFREMLEQPDEKLLP
jgi:GNAT superfamily N-acetyltransferase